MTYFNFERLINKYSSEFILISKSDGHYDDAGDWVDGEITQTTMNGAIIGFTENKIYRSEGTITAQDKQLHTLTEIDNALMGSIIIYNGNKYKIEEQKGKDNAKFTGVFSYVLKWVSVFND